MIKKRKREGGGKAEEGMEQAKKKKKKRTRSNRKRRTKVSEAQRSKPTRRLINRCKIYAFIYRQEFISSAVQIADGRGAPVVRVTSTSLEHDDAETNE